MRLIKAASHFDKLTCLDAYSGATLFKGQWNLYDGSVRDGLTVQRRVISVAPSVVIPGRRAISVLGEQWIIGDDAPDYYADAGIRKGYVVHRPDELATFKTIPQFLAGAAGTQAYAAKLWVKTGKEVEVSSTATDQMNIYAAIGEPLATGMLAYLGGVWCFIHSTYVSAAGFLTAIATELDSPAVTATLVTRTYAPTTDTFSVSQTTAAALRLRWQESFTYLTESSETYQRGDIQLMLLTAAGTPTTKDQITLPDGTWRIMSVINAGTHWSLHLRRG